MVLRKLLDAAGERQDVATVGADRRLLLPDADDVAVGEQKEADVCSDAGAAADDDRQVVTAHMFLLFMLVV